MDIKKSIGPNGMSIEVSLLSWEVQLKRSTCIWVTVLIAVVFGLFFF